MKKYILLLAMIAMSFISIGQSVSRVPYRIPNDLDVAGGVKIRNTNWAAGGVIKFASGHFYGYTGTEWIRLDSVSAGVVPVDNVFDWRNGAYRPYASKLSSDPGFAYFYSEDVPPNHNNGLYLDGALTSFSQVIQNSFLPWNSMALAPNYFSLEYGYPGAAFIGQIGLMPTEFRIQSKRRDSPETAMPIKIGGIEGDTNDEHIIIDDNNQLFDINMTNIRLNKGVANSWLALDDDRNITYMDAPDGGGEVLWTRDAGSLQPSSYGDKIYNIVDGETFSIKGVNDTGPGLVGSSTSSDGVYGESYGFNGVRGVSTTATGVSGTGGAYGVLGQTTSGIGVRGGTTTGTAVSGVATTTGVAISGVASTGIAGSFQTGANTSVSATTTSGLAYLGVANPITTNSVHNIVDLRRTTSGTAASGIGASISFSIEQANGALATSGVFSNVMTNVSTGSGSSKFDWALRDAGKELVTKMSLSPTGKLTVDSLRLTSGSANKWLALDANLNVKYMDEPAGGIGSGIYDSIYWRRVGTEAEGTIFPKVELDKVRLGDELNYTLLSGDGIEIFDDANDIYGTIDVTGDRLNLHSSNGVSLGVESNVQNIVVSGVSGDLSTVIYGGVTLHDGSPEKWLALDDNNEVVYMSPPEGAVNAYESNLSVVPVESFSAGPKFGIGQDSTHYTLPTATGGTIYIDPSLSLPGSGTLSSPYNSWTFVTFQSNRTYCQKRGTKYESAIALPSPENLGPIVITDYGDPVLPKPIIIYTGTSDIDFIEFDNSYGMISNLDIQSIGIVGNGVMVRGGDPGTYVYNCDIKGFSVGVYAYPENNAQNDAWEKLYILYNEIHGQAMDGIYVDDVTNMEIAHNNIYDINRNYEINPLDQNVAGGDCVQIAVGGFDNILKFSVHHNTFDRTSSGNKFGFIWAGQSGQTTGEIRNNIFTGVKGSAMNSVSGLYMGVSSDTIWVTNNLFKNVGNACFTENSNVVAAYNIVENCLVGFAMRDAGRGYLLFNNIINRYDVAAVSRLGGYLTSYNNVFMPKKGGLARVYSGVTGTFASDYNYMTGAVTSTQNLAQWRAATTYDDNTLSSGALLSDSINTGRPLIGSPLLEAGTPYRVVDYYGSVIDSDFIGDYVPVLQTPIGPFQYPKSGSSYYTEEAVLSQYGGPVVIGDYASGNYVRFDKNGAMTFHGESAYPPGGSNPAVAKGASDGELQYYRGGIVGTTTGLGFVSNVLSSPGNIRGGVVTITSNPSTFNVTAGRTFVTSANAIPVTLGALTGESSAIGAYVTIVCGSATNATRINNSPPYYLTAEWRPDSIGDNITLLIAADNVYYEVSRSNLVNP